MTPAIPLSPRQKRQRRNNIIFCSVCACVTIAALTYLFLPEQEDSPEPRQTPTASTTYTPKHSALPRTERAARSGDTVTTMDTSAVAPQSTTETSITAESGPTTTSSAPVEVYDEYEPDSVKSRSALLMAHAEVDAAAEEPATAAAPDQLSEEELAKLPPWQAAFERLPINKRRAFASCFISAKIAYAAQQWSTCLSHLNDCDLIYNGSPNVWNLRSCALLANQEPEKAEESINRSLELNPDDNVALMCQAERFMLLRDFRSSLAPLERLRRLHPEAEDRTLHDTFTFQQLLCHLMLRQEMEARALVADCTPLTDSPLYYYSQAAFCIYAGDSQGALEPLRACTAIYGSEGICANYRKWMERSGLADKYVRNRKH